MPPRTHSNKQTVTHKHQASNVDETVNKCPKTKDNNDQDNKKKKKANQNPASKVNFFSFDNLQILISINYLLYRKLRTAKGEERSFNMSFFFFFLSFLLRSYD